MNVDPEFGQLITADGPILMDPKLNVQRAVRQVEESAKCVSVVALEALSSMLGSRFSVEAAPPTIQNDRLYPEELAHICGAVQKRQAEFATARVCARKALIGLGESPCSLAPHADRSPRWPKGVVGSISHTEECCAVAVTHSRWVAGLGIDVESEATLPAELEELVCTRNERAWLEHYTKSDRAWLGKLFFSAKEAVYKCQYMLSRSFMDFRDVELAIDVDRGTFSVTHLSLDGAGGGENMLRLEGKFRRLPRLIATVAIL
ncbi:4'-phosphopantetheinyl transferase family protein [Bradyrhizobium iriomotense]|uniref:Enterobactin synthase component D n=1 Tax=Bradyrhizobium iriomotense TaxID=441950 RepID=A0ABQ6AQ41_9BRAD|nr:4'-phosphopantetheinyl transferase superfamily protein [Bradyrhizobium iriomotense]GLR83550.1 hypothetical protein GCM10007857_02600 [Bradyrhizobium iriomotense]